ncbi:MAG: class I SAM-dependent methyltransferase [Coriobacteriia bacterium]|nr:class I SAM-dependent methyltransferase [Coriobacteriia bacterium]
MRLGVTSANPLIWALAAVGWLPSPLLVAFWGMESSRALIVASEVGLFDALASGPRTADELAAATECDPHGVQTLANALTGFGYLKRRNGSYRLRRGARRWLLSDSRVSLKRPMGLLDVMWDELGDLETRVREGGSRDFHRPERDAAFWARYLEGLGAAAALTAPLVVRSIDVGRGRRLLDVGGGHGAFSVAMCRRHPGLHATVLDLEPATVVGRRLVAEAGLTDRIDFSAGDLTDAEWGENHDVVLLFNLLHIFDTATAAAVVRRAHDALAPGGTVAILDASHKESRGGVSAVGGGSELLFFAINDTQAYPEATLVRWVEEAGFADVRVRHTLGMPEVLITARRCVINT